MRITFSSYYHVSGLAKGEKNCYDISARFPHGCFYLAQSVVLGENTQRFQLSLTHGEKD